jgi:hypothetical protein
MDAGNECRFITNVTDLQTALKNCKRCNNITMNGRFIYSHEHLSILDITRCKKKKIAIIINSESDPSLLGHWVVCLVSHKFLLFLDGQQQIFSKRNDVMSNIYSFCNRNSLKFINLKFNIQKNNSFKCGFVVLFFIAKFSILSFQSFLALKHVLNNNSISTNEKYILMFVKRHFHINI